MTDYQNALVLDNLDLVNWVIRTRISIPNRPLLTYDDFYAIGCEAICRAALKYNADTGEFAPFACRYIYNAIVDHCRAINFRMERNVEIPENEDTALLDLLAHTSVDFDESAIVRASIWRGIFYQYQSFFHNRQQLHTVPHLRKAVRNALTVCITVIVNRQADKIRNGLPSALIAFFLKFIDPRSCSPHRRAINLKKGHGFFHVFLRQGTSNIKCL